MEAFHYTQCPSKPTRYPASPFLDADQFLELLTVGHILFPRVNCDHFCCIWAENYRWKCSLLNREALEHHSKLYIQVSNALQSSHEICGLSLISHVMKPQLFLTSTSVIINDCAFFLFQTPKFLLLNQVNHLCTLFSAMTLILFLLCIVFVLSSNNSTSHDENVSHFDSIFTFTIKHLKFTIYTQIMQKYVFKCLLYEYACMS